MFMATTATESGEFNLLEDGVVDAVVAGLRGFVGTKFESNEPEDKVQIVFQTQDADGVLHYLATKPMVGVISPKSNLFKVLSGITGYTIDKFPNGFDLTQIVNAEKPVKCQLVVKTVPSKKDPARSYNEIDSYLKAKKGQKYTFVPDSEAPSWLNTNIKEALWLPGLAFQAPKEPAPAKAAIPEAVATQLGNSSAFFGQAQNPTNPQFAPVQQPSPYVAPMTKAQQVAERQQATQYVPPAAPAPQPVFGQAPAAPTAPVVDDSDSDLPF